MDVSTFLSGVRTTSDMPDNKFTDPQVLAMADREMSVVLQQIMSVREEYFVTYQDQSSADVEASGGLIPTGSIGRKLRALDFVDGDGQHYRAERISLDEVSEGRRGWYVMGDRIHFNLLSPVPAATVRMFYYQRPASLVAATPTADIGLPEEWAPVLVQRVVVKMLEAEGDSPGFSRAQAKLKELEAAALALIAERVVGQTQRVHVVGGVRFLKYRYGR